MRSPSSSPWGWRSRIWPQPTSSTAEPWRRGKGLGSSWGANATRAAEAVSLEEVWSARDRIAGAALRIPLVRLNLDDAPTETYLKLENLQSIGSFKIRGAANAMAMANPDELTRGVYTASAGNMAQGVAWNARRIGIPCISVVPET